jgi:hypothetical protein
MDIIAGVESGYGISRLRRAGDAFKAAGLPLKSKNRSINRTGFSVYPASRSPDSRLALQRCPILPTAVKCS